MKLAALSLQYGNVELEVGGRLMLGARDFGGERRQDLLELDAGLLTTGGHDNSSFWFLVSSFQLRY